MGFWRSALETLAKRKGVRAVIDNEIMLEDMEYVFGKNGSAQRFVDKTIVITGCGGFLGYYLTNCFVYLKSKGFPYRKLILLDTFLFGRPRWLEELERHHEDVEVHRFDIARDELEQAASALSADFVIHMASIASPSYYRKYPVETIEANVLGLRRLLEFYKHRPLDGLLFFSSSEVYGDPAPEAIPTPETYLGNVASIGPRACYDESKRMGETLCYVYHQTYGMPIRIVRPFNNYGPGMALTDKRVPADFAQAVLRGEDVVIYSDGRPTRTFCYIADAVDGYLRVLTHDEFGCFNIGMDRPEISVRRLADIYREAAAELWGYGGEVRFIVSEEKDYLTDNPNRRCPDITKARMALGFRPEISVERGVRRYLRYLRKELLPV
ncbi:NAD-dependent epimerase/dehydratase family protein [Paenibacillus hamazuiensis]|uniref:NAD-dependent epimerase/dehydratase family protein n=1 Tax=Paenibacillus hamazuiensis TaxID=2936508 RepID=UPI00200E5AAF|nr:NAD-dependent epimerase/dehydratase family protein [Paenibacillus hamazuiensis]